jgi:plasmid stability protein
VLAFCYRFYSIEIAMSALLIKDFPPELHQKLKEEAARYHRSMTRQALALLEQALTAPTRNAADRLPTPIKPAKKLPTDDVVAVIRQGREADAQ